MIAIEVLLASAPNEGHFLLLGYRGSRWLYPRSDMGDP